TLGIRMPVHIPQISNNTSIKIIVGFTVLAVALTIIGKCALSGVAGTSMMWVGTGLGGLSLVGGLYFCLKPLYIYENAIKAIMKWEEGDGTITRKEAIEVYHILECGKI